MAVVNFSRGFSVPKASLSELSNPLAVENLYAKGGRLHEGDDEGVSFSMKVSVEEKETHHTLPELRQGSEHYARVRTANKEGYIPVVVVFSLNEQTFSLLKGKICIPSILELGKSHTRTVLKPIETFDELVKLDEGEVVIQGGQLTPEQLRQLSIEIGTASTGKENQKISLQEALDSKAEFNYRKFEIPQTTPEGKKPSLGESGSLLK